MKKLIATVWLIFLTAIISSIFWYNQFIYALPTPVPATYKAVPTGKKIHLSAALTFKNNRPLFLHFFNPECPCSRFNIDHFKLLVKQYHEQLNFAIVLVASRPYTEKEIQKRFNIDVAVVSDHTLAIASGVYSTPQAVILNTDQTLYYRGNYNKTRYCTDQKTSYAQLAIESLMHKTSPVKFDRYALTAYGCTLPNCEK